MTSLPGTGRCKNEYFRQTFGNIIASAHRKVADFTINSQRLTVGGGAVEIGEMHFCMQFMQPQMLLAKRLSPARQMPAMQRQ